MDSYTIPGTAGAALQIALVGFDSTGTSRGLANVSVTIDDTTDVYIADGGPNSGGFPTFFVVPRQNLPSGVPLTAAETRTLTINANDPVLGGALPTLTLTVTLQTPPPPPAHSTNLGVQGATTVTLTAATTPADPGTATLTNLQ